MITKGSFLQNYFQAGGVIALPFAFGAGGFAKSAVRCLRVQFEAPATGLAAAMGEQIGTLAAGLGAVAASWIRGRKRTAAQNTSSQNRLRVLIAMQLRTACI